MGVLDGVIVAMGYLLCYFVLLGPFGHACSDVPQRAASGPLGAWFAKPRRSVVRDLSLIRIPNLELFPVLYIVLLAAVGIAGLSGSGAIGGSRAAAVVCLAADIFLLTTFIAFLRRPVGRSSNHRRT
jgi:hypothetical protein